MARPGQSVACIVQARAGTAPLPDKVLSPLGGAPALVHVLRRCQAIPGVGAVICVGAADADGDAVVQLAKGLDITVFRGRDADMLACYREAARAAGAEVVLRVTGDCPLIDPEVCGEVLRLLAAEGADYAANNMPPSWPHGLDCEAFTVEALEEANDIATDPDDRAQVTPWIRRNRAYRRVNLPGPGGELTEQRWMLDFPEDLAFLRALYDRWTDLGTYPGWRDIAELVAREPQLALINEGRKQR